MWIILLRNHFLLFSGPPEYRNGPSRMGGYTNSVFKPDLRAFTLFLKHVDRVSKHNSQ
jgi:hypothetical protein